MIAAWLALTAAWAGEWSEPKPYVLPILNLNAAVVNGETFVQASGGLEGGVRLRYKQNPHWLSHTRGRVVGMYGIPSGSLGADVRVGSFIGPDFKLLRYQIGPDVWCNGYGARGALDYYLPWSPGVDLSNVVTLKLVKEFQIIGEATPGWAFVADRQNGGVGPFHELTLAVMGVIRTAPIRLTVGYVRRYQTYGIYEGLILAGAI